MFSCAFAAIYKPPVTERYIDPTMIAILVAMALMFVIICVVLRLFSKSVLLLPKFLLLFIMFSNIHHLQQCSMSCVFSIKYIHQKQKIIHSRSSYLLVIYRLIILINGLVFGTLYFLNLTVKLKGGVGEFTLFDQN